MNLPKLIDNKHRTLADAIRDIAPTHTHLSIATGYWDIEGTLLVLDQVKNYDKIRLLVGREPLLKRDNYGEISVPEPDYPDSDFFQDLINTNPSPEIKQAVIELYHMIEEGKLEVRVYRRSFLHAKCYIFGSQDSEQAIGIVGSSNFTKAGLERNAELNALESDHRVVLFNPKSDSQDTGHLAWFDELWDDEKAERWNGAFTELIRTSPVGDLLYSPHELYIRTLYELYKHEIESEKEEIINPHSYQLYEFQQKNVKNLMRILNEHGVAMLADSVGLGKTISCIGVIKQYRKQRVVVIAPASLKKHWQDELHREGLRDVHVISLQNKDEIARFRSYDEYAPVGLFVIDESHNLRSHNASRYELLADWIADSRNDEAHVLLTTATPINNSLDDLVNQVLLGARGDQDVFTIPVKTSEGQVVTRSFYEAVQNIKKRIQQQIARGASEDALMDIYEDARHTLEPVIQSFVIRNTRQSIGELVNTDGSVMAFPEPKIRSRRYEHHILEKKTSRDIAAVHQYSVESLAETMDTMLHPLRQVEQFTEQGVEQLKEDRSTIYRLYQLILALSFVPYRWRMYDPRVYGKTRDELRVIRFGRGEEKEAINRQISIYGIIRTTFLKRLESSAHALEKSLDTYRRRLTLFSDILNKKNIIINLSDLDDILDEYEESSIEDVLYSDEELQKLAEEKGVQNANEYHKKELIEDIKREIQLIDELQSLVVELKTRDAKFEDFKRHLLDEYARDSEKKILVFAFYSDTIAYLEQKLKADPQCAALLSRAAFVSGATRGNALRSADRFSPIARRVKLADDEHELTHLFTTDVLSEGQNIQDAGHLINYDLHWNPVRMIQRNGRINRIGSRFSEITVENYFPARDLDDFLRLEERLRRKIELIKQIIGTDASVLGEAIDPRAYTGVYSDDEREATSVYLRLENKAGAFAEDIFKRDLLNFYKSASETERRRIERIPYGSWSRGAEYGAEAVITLGVFTLKEVEEEFTGHYFFTNNLQGNAIDLLIRPLALRAIHSNNTERTPKPLAIDAERHEVVTTKNGSQIIQAGATEDRTLTPTQKKVHEYSRGLGWTAEESDLLFATILTRNVLLQRKMNRLVRSINSALKENRDVSDYYKELREILTAPKNPPAITKSEFVFGYSPR